MEMNVIVMLRSTLPLSSSVHTLLPPPPGLQPSTTRPKASIRLIGISEVIPKLSCTNADNRDVNFHLFFQFIHLLINMK
jgi:hypothetical protein